MGSRAILHMRCRHLDDVDAVRLRYRLFSDELRERSETYAAWLRREFVVNVASFDQECWHCPVDLDSHPPFVSVAGTFATLTPADVDGLARDLDTEVIFVFRSSITENFQFTRSLAGNLQRHLFNKGDKGWDEVLGNPEPWEARVFSLERLDEIEKFYDYGQFEELDEMAVVKMAYEFHELDLNDLWGKLDQVRKARRVPAVSLPDTFFDQWDTVRLIDEYHGLPDWRNGNIWLWPKHLLC